MNTAVGSRVMALLRAGEGKVYVMGAGEYLGLKVPTKCGVPAIDSFAEHGIPNPAIKLDNGVEVYGMECWWGPVEAVKARYKDWEFVVLPVSEYRPKKEVSHEDH